MLPLLIKRWRDTDVDSKQALRAYIDQLPVDQQRAFVAAALQLLDSRNMLQYTRHLGA